MRWSSEGIILSVRKHGETSAIIELMTPDRGRHLGLVRGGAGRRMRPILQPGNSVDATWSARLSEHLGAYTVELSNARTAKIMTDRLALSALNAACSMAVEIVPERQVYPKVYAGLRVFLDNIDDVEIWPILYVHWEMQLLSALGYGLDLSSCAASGETQNLTHVSPRSGRAVCAREAEPYLDKLFALPEFLKGDSEGSVEDIMAGLNLTGHFISSRIFWPVNKAMPEARANMVDQLKQRLNYSG